jgi:threonine synthase
MDVGNPSNFIRIQELFHNEFGELKAHLSSYSFDDETTKDAIKEVYENTGYVMDPHGAVGYLGLETFLNENPDYQGIFLETAHPVKFLETVENVIGKKLEIPGSIQSILQKEKQSIEIGNYSDLKDFLIQ